MKKYLLIGVAWLSIVHAIHAQKLVFKYKNMSSTQGLSVNNATCVLQDRKGFIWIGTRDGLNKYDGYTFTIYRRNHEDSTSIGGNFILSVKEDQQGNLWIGTYDGGLSKYEWKSDKFIRYVNNPQNPNSLSHNSVQSVLVDKQDNLWIGTKGGLDLLDTKKNQFIHYQHHSGDPGSLAHNDVYALLEDKTDHLWVGTGKGGLDQFDRKRNRFIHFQNDPANVHSISQNAVLSIYEDREENLWVGTDSKGLNLLDRKTNTFTRFQHEPDNPNSLSHNTILCINEDDKGYLWLGTENGGLNLYNKKKKLFYRYMQDDKDPLGISANSFEDIYKDNKGNLWLSTFGGGVDFLDQEPAKFASYKKEPNNSNSLSHNNVNTFTEDDKGQLWIGTDGGGITVFDRKNNTFRHYRHQSTPTSLPSDVVLTIRQSRDKTFYIGMYRGGGFSRLTNPESGKFYTFPVDTAGNSGIAGDNVLALLEDKKGNWWVGTSLGGLNYYDKSNSTFIHYLPDPKDAQRISSMNISTLFQDENENLWIGTMGGGLDLRNKDTYRFTHYKHDDNDPRSLSNNRVLAIYKDKKKNLWIGTNNGLNLFHPDTQTFTHYFLKDGLPSNVIQSILEDSHGNLWMGTNNGISCFNPVAKTFRNYELNDGLQGPNFNRGAYLKTRKGEMLFGGSRGFTIFHPDSIRINPFIPPVFITDFQIFNKSVKPSEKDSPLKSHINDARELTLSYKQSVFSLDYAALNYTLPEKSRYAYILEGFDKGWNYVGTQRKATYTNLDPGEYTFRVKATNNDGVWNEKGTSIKIYITPPYWATWWFRMLMVAGITGCIYTFVRNRINTIKQQRVLLEEKIRQGTAEITKQNEELQRQRQEAEKARQEAEEANKAKSVFLATMSHEIRTPMNGVIGMASLLAETSQTSEQQEYTETIKSCGESLLTVINDILDFSKIESGKMELEEKDFDLRTCIEEVLDVFATKAVKVGLDLIYEIDYNVPSQIIGDVVRLRQIILNLVSNAVKFTHKGEVFVGVHLLHAQGHAIELGFEVRDTGIGIPKDKINQLFKAFSQVDSSTTRKYGGTGLGLVICEKLVGLMGGKILVESVADQGTTFTFTIRATVSQESSRTYVHHHLANIEGRKILVVDDNFTNRSIFKNQLEQWKLIPTLAVSGAEALEILSQVADFDLVLSDMQMPEMDGIDLARQIRRKQKGLPIILLSSVGDDKTKEYTELFASVLTKPVKQAMLFKHIVAQLNPQKGKTMVEETTSKKKLSTDFARQYPLRILVTEDNPVNQKLAERILTKLGYSPDQALNGQEALNALDAKIYDVVLMDVQMPVMDGLEATRRIRLRTDSQPLIVAMTANAMQGDREICLQAGMDDYISKPIKLENLVELLEKWALQIMSPRLPVDPH
ncbi:hybrid sensor histidine kinase/response regulator [Parachryseolinea silvisoli]|uniref:hybrid sensor histidine kinase/response regulator n=1 Tax=Parachryseolinea silvisoli TaxID=2873601 RepID=UPI0022657DC8|nr:hybrid sensor histidine kinase/response regulator [Parachryseolinea silvisoli]MCD9016713.1 response regulator [Parachryseolinea silvisoli]